MRGDHQIIAAPPFEPTVAAALRLSLRAIVNAVRGPLCGHNAAKVGNRHTIYGDVPFLHEEMATSGRITGGQGASRTTRRVTNEGNGSHSHCTQGYSA